MCVYTISNPALCYYMDDRFVAEDFVCGGSESVLTVRDSDLERRTPFAPKAVVRLAAHLDDVSAS